MISDHQQKIQQKRQATNQVLSPPQVPEATAFEMLTNNANRR